MIDDARTLIAQHAKTAELLGVDFLPLGEVASALASAPAAIEPDPPTQVNQPRQSKPSKPSKQSIHGEPDSSGLGSVIDLAELRACTAGLDEPEARLDALRVKYEAQEPHQHFNTRFTKIVFGEGSAVADLMFVGEAPGEQEDLTGRPFVGPAGQLLEKMIVAMGYSRETVYITNVLKTRPVGDATPTGEEMALCEPYLLEQIRIVNPRVVVTLGLCASQLLLKVSSPMRSMRGCWHSIDAGGSEEVAAMPTYHPAYLLRSYTQENRQKVWSDLTQVIEKLKEHAE